MRILAISVAMLMVLVASASAWTLSPKLIASGTGYSSMGISGTTMSSTNYGVGVELAYPIFGSWNFVGEVGYLGANTAVGGSSNTSTSLLGAVNAVYSLRSPFYVGGGVNYSSYDSGVTGSPKYSGIGFQLIGGFDIENYLAQIKFISGTLKPDTGTGDLTSSQLLIEAGYRFSM
jgi:hypothetical protein